GNNLSEYYEDSYDYWYKYDYTYDNDGNILSEYNEDTDGDWDKYAYTYDSNGNLSTVYCTSSDGSWNKYTYTYIQKSSLMPPEPVFTVSGGGIANTGTDAQTAEIIIASYDDNGVLINAARETADFNAGETKEYELGENDRIFVWNSRDGIIR
ncbi:MAG: hypothetical protein LUF26_03880, partial [Firmicutes bacterium]|nr:hypothetical protein [Bacillota bacterium]